VIEFGTQSLAIVGSGGQQFYLETNLVQQPGKRAVEFIAKTTTLFIDNFIEDGR